MNIFDVILLLIAFTLIFKSRMKDRVFKIVLIIGFVTSVIQVIVVGYKWQYIPIYIIFLSLAIGITLGIKFDNKLLKGASFILNSILVEVANLLKNEKIFPFYISVNMPGAKENNDKLVKKYKKFNPHL